MEFIARLFDTSDFPARWRCGNWTPGHGWMHILSDVGVWAAYFAIPLVLAYFIARRRDLPFRRVFLLFVAFILLCGMTHLMEAVIFWWPAYRLAGILKLLTAIVSWVTVLALVRVAPAVLAMRTPEELEREVAARTDAETRLKEANAELERRVEERTADLARSVAALQQERELLRTTLLSIGDGVVTTDAAGRVTKLNGVAEALTGWSDADSQGRPLESVFRIVNESTRQPVVNPALRALKEGVVVGLANHTILIGKDGAERSIDDSAAPIRSASGEVLGCILVFRDIGERKALEAEQRAVQEQLATTLESITDGFIRFDRDWRIVYANAEAERINQLPRSEMLGRILWEVFPALVGTILETEFRRAVAEQVTVDFENYYKPFGRWYSLKGYPTPDGGMTTFIRDITERKQAENVLRRSEARLRRVFESNVVGMIRWDLDRGLIVDANDEFLRMTGYTRDDVAAGRLNFREMTPAEWTVRNEEGIRGIRADGHAVPYEKEYFRKDGSRVPLIIAGTRFEDSSSEGMSLLIDISDRKRAEQEIARLAAASERQRRLYETVLTNTPDFMYVFSLDHKVVYANDALIRMWGRGLEGAIGKTFLEIGYEPWHAEMHEREIDQVRATRQPIRGEVPFTGTLGQRQYDYIFVPVIGADGGVEAVAGTTRDVTERKETERRLRESEERSAFVRRSSGVGFWYCDLPFDVLQWDELVKAHFHLPPDAAVTIQTFYDRLHPDDREPTRLAIERSIGGRTHYNVVYRTVHPDTGAETWVRAIGRTFYAADGTPTRFDGVTLDVSEQKRAEEERERLVGQLRDADRRKDEFLATLAHELRNPLAPIRNGLQVIRMAGATGPVEQARSMMERQLTQMVRLVDDLLDVSRVTTGKLTLSTECLEIRTVIEAAIETSRPLIEHAGHNLSVEVPAEPIHLEGDLTRLAQVISNLLTNSAKYTHRGGHIRVSVGREDAMAVVSVKDDGIGIPAAMLGRVFDMFIQVDRTLEKTTGGLGIGLSLVRGLVEMHGGTIEARSGGEGKGSEFVVRLPVAAAAPSNGSDNGGDAPAPSALRRILVVDDNADSADSLGQLLEMLGNEVRTAYDGEAGIAAAAAFRPGLVLCDIGMPKMNGYDVAGRIRSEEWGKKILLVALTGWGQDEDRKRSSQAGFDFHLVKPVEPAALLKLLADLKPASA